MVTKIVYKRNVCAGTRTCNCSCLWTRTVGQGLEKILNLTFLIKAQKTHHVFNDSLLEVQLELYIIYFH